MIVELFTVHQQELLKYCMMMCGNESDAEDLLQETFMRAFANLDVLEDLDEKQRRAWLYKVARNLFFDMCRRQSVRKNHPLYTEEAIEGGFTEVETAMILSTLPPDLSQVFIRRYYQGYTSEELAEEYGLSASGIRAMLSRARKALKENLNE